MNYNLILDDIIKNKSEFLISGESYFEEYNDRGFNSTITFYNSYSGNYDLALEAGHQKPRVLHCKDHTGLSIQQILEKFTNGQKGTMISDCPVYIETMTGHLEDIRRIEVQESVIVGDSNPARLVIKADKDELYRSLTYKQS